MEDKSIKIVKRYIKKNGEEVIKFYDQKKYNDKYYKINSDKIKEKYYCNFCNKNIIKANKHNHEKTKIHILHSKYNIDIKNI